MLTKDDIGKRAIIAVVYDDSGKVFWENSGEKLVGFDVLGYPLLKNRYGDVRIYNKYYIRVIDES